MLDNLDIVTHFSCEWLTMKLRLHDVLQRVTLPKYSKYS